MKDTTSAPNNGGAKRSVWSRIDTFVKENIRIGIGILIIGLLIEIAVFLGFILTGNISDNWRDSLFGILLLTVAAIISFVLYTTNMFTSMKDKEEILNEIQQVKGSIETLTKTTNENHKKLIEFLDKRLPRLDK